MENFFKGLFSLLKPLLYPLSLLYGLVVWLRNKVYDKGIYNSIQFSVPVISVGNLSAGGTGKTPHIEYLIQLLQYQYKVATMSRGYRRKTSGFRLASEEDTSETIGDEPMQFFKKFPEAYVTVCADRMAGIPELISLRPDTEVVLLDDAFQHRSVKPGLNILLTDYYKPFYKDYILPFGRLREGRSGYVRADVIVVTKCPENLSPNEKKEIIEQIKPLSHQSIFFSKIVYKELYDFYSRQPVTLPENAHLVAVSGIARPQPMLDYLRSKAKFVHLLQYPDHHYFSLSDLEEMKATYDGWDETNKALAVSEKDAARLTLHREKLASWQIPVYVLPIQVSFLEKEEAFNNQILAYIQKEQEENQWD